MSRPKPGMMTIPEQLFEAAESHGDAEGVEYQIGDLEILFEAVWPLLTPEQRRDFFRLEAIVELKAGIDYEHIKIDE